VEIILKPVLAALAGASLLALAFPAAAQHHGGGFHGGGGGGTAPAPGGPGATAGAPGGGFHGGGPRGGGISRGGAASGGWRGGGWSDGRSSGGGRGYYPGGGYSYNPWAYGSFGLGLALGLEARDPWYYDYPYYGYRSYEVSETMPDDGYDDHRPYGYAAEQPPPTAADRDPPPGCGSWSWDPRQDVYTWNACKPAPAH
jgi:hypothetical protein